MSNGLKLLFVADGDPENPAKSGSGSPASLIKALRALGHEITPVDASLRGWRRYLVAAATYRRGRKAWRARFWLDPIAFRMRSRIASAAIRHHQSRAAYDAVLMYGNDCLPSTAPAIPLYLYVDNFSLHTARIPHSNMAQLRPAEQAAAHASEASVWARASHLFTLSEYIAGQFATLGEVAPEKITTVYAGFSIDPTLASKVSDGRHGSRRILFVGRDWVYKGGPTMLQAFRLVRQALPDAELVIIGPRDVPDEVKREEGVTFLGFLDKSREADARTLAEAYGRSAVFALPTEYDSFPIVLLEAMATGIPAVTTRIWALPEMVVDGETGFTVPKGDHRELARAIIDCIGSEERGRALGERARTRTESLFTWDRVARRIADRIGADVARSAT